jgi:hypothetical protein
MSPRESPTILMDVVIVNRQYGLYMVFIDVSELLLFYLYLFSMVDIMQCNL